MEQPQPFFDGSPIGAYRFGVFELDVREGELRKQGRLIRLRGQPLRILLALLEHPGDVVTREELQRRLWPDDTFVEFDHSLNTAIKRLREALGDTASTPRFVETVPRKGYRFTARLEPIVPPPPLTPAAAIDAAPSASSQPANGGAATHGVPAWPAPAVSVAVGPAPLGSAPVVPVLPAAQPVQAAHIVPGAHAVPGEPTAHRGGVRLAAAAATALVILVAVALMIMWRGSREATTAAAADADAAVAAATGRGSAGTGVGTGSAIVATPAPRVAVLPFQNLSGDEGRGHVAAGFTEELIPQLGRLAPGRLGAIARSSSATFTPSLASPPVATPLPAPAPSLEEIARALNADYIIEGSVRTQGERYRVAVRLVRARDVLTVWSDLHEGALLDLMTMQRDVGEQVARHLALAVLPADRAALARATTADSRAYEEYLRGVSELARGPVDGFAGAQAAFERAIARDPRYALAYAGLAETHIRQQDYYIISPALAQQTARPAAAKALALDDSLAEAHCALADVFSRGEGQAAEAERSFARALALNPSRAETHLRYASHLHRIGRGRDARARLALARRLAPRSADVITEIAWTEMDDGRLDAAAALAGEMLRYQPDYPYARYVLGQLALQRAAAKEAVSQFEQARVTSGQAPKYVAALATAYLADGRRADAVHLLEVLTAQSRDRYVPPGIIETLSASLRSSAGQLARGSR